MNKYISMDIKYFFLGGIIILTCRDPSKGEETKQKILKLSPKASIFVHKLNLACLDDIKSFVQNLPQRKIDILINLAGVQDFKFQMTDLGFENHCVTNYLGHFYLIHLLIPLLSNSKSRIINITDDAYKSVELDLINFNMTSNWDCRNAYAQSKLCLVLMTKHLAKILPSNRITINAVAPGKVRTNLIQNSPFHSLLKAWSYPLLWIFYKSPKQGAQSVIYLCADGKFDKVSGKVIR